MTERECDQLLVERVQASPVVTAGHGVGSRPATGAEGAAVAVAVREAPSAERLGWLPFWVALPIAPAGIYVGAFVTTLVLQWLQPWVPLR